MRIIFLPLLTLQNGLQLRAVGGTQFFFKITGLKFYGNDVVIRADEAAAPFKMRDRHGLCFG